VFVWLTRESVKDDEISDLIAMSGISLSKHTPNAVRTAARSPPNAPKVWAGKDKTPQPQRKEMKNGFDTKTVFVLFKIRIFL
jgi:DNA-binding protein H-NS